MGLVHATSCRRRAANTNALDQTASEPAGEVPGPMIWLVAWGSRGDHEPVLTLALALRRRGLRVKVFGNGIMARMFMQQGLVFEPNDRAVILHEGYPKARAWLSQQALEAGFSGPNKEEDFLIDFEALENEYAYRTIGVVGTFEYESVTMREIDRYVRVMWKQGGYEAVTAESLRERHRKCAEWQAAETGMSLEKCLALRAAQLRKLCDFLRKVASQFSVGALDIFAAFRRNFEIQIMNASPAEILWSTQDFFRWRAGEDVSSFWTRWSMELGSWQQMSVQKMAIGLVKAPFKVIMRNMCLSLDSATAAERPGLVVTGHTALGVFAAMLGRRGVRCMLSYQIIPPVGLRETWLNLSDSCDSMKFFEDDGPEPLLTLGAQAALKACMDPRNLLIGVSGLTLLDKELETRGLCLSGDLGRRLPALRERATGFWVTHEAEQDSAALQTRKLVSDFLAASAEPVVYLGWGSMPVPGGATLVAQTLRLAGVRGIFVAGWSGVTAQALKAAMGEDWQRALFLESAPHGWLLPLCACAVHHGGMGTCHASLRAGVPTIVAPFSFDQPRNGRWIEALGCGICTSLLTVVTPGELAGALRRMLADPGMRARAQWVGSSMRAERGIEGAVDLIQRRLEEAPDEHALEEDSAGQQSSPWLDGRYVVFEGGVHIPQDLEIRGGAIFQRGSPIQPEERVGWLQYGSFAPEDEPGSGEPGAEERPYTVQALNIHPAPHILYGTVAHDGQTLTFRGGVSYHHEASLLPGGTCW